MPQTAVYGKRQRAVIRALKNITIIWVLLSFYPSRKSSALSKSIRWTATSSQNVGNSKNLFTAISIRSKTNSRPPSISSAKISLIKLGTLTSIVITHCRPTKSLKIRNTRNWSKRISKPYTNSRIRSAKWIWQRRKPGYIWTRWKILSNFWTTSRMLWGDTNLLSKHRILTLLMMGPLFWKLTK